MIKEYQVTLTSTTGQYKPISCIVKYEQETEEDLTKVKEEKVKIQKLGVQKICGKRYWSGADLKKYGYLKAKIRLYDKEAIAKANAENYAKLKEEMYLKGVWKRPKNEQV